MDYALARELTTNKGRTTMSRAVTTKEQLRLMTDRAVDAEDKDNQYADRVLKYIPAEVVTLYVALSSTVASMEDPARWLPWAIFSFGIVAVIVHLKTVKETIPNTQIAISTVSLVVWVFALPNGPFAELSWYEQVYGALLLPAYTFLVARIIPSEENGNANE
jgi:hypothetical protein